MNTNLDEIYDSFTNLMQSNLCEIVDIFFDELCTHAKSDQLPKPTDAHMFLDITKDHALHMPHRARFEQICHQKWGPEI